MNASDKDFRDGWNDCREYWGEDLSRNESYRRGFAACLKAYHDALSKGLGWDAVDDHDFGEKR